MTTEPTPAERVFIPTGHPVRRAFLVLAALVVLLGVAWACGLVTPRLVLSVGGRGQNDVATGDGMVTIWLDNAAFADVDLEGAEILADGVVTTGADLAGVALGQGPTLRAKQTQVLTVRYQVGGCPDVPPPHEWRLSLITRTPLGLTRTVTVPVPASSPVCRA